MSWGVQRCDVDDCAYFYSYDNSDFIILLLNDMLVEDNNMNDIANLKARLAKEF